MKNKLGHVTVYCGSRFGEDPRFEAAAKALGTCLAERGSGLVYGGARVGLMGAVADAALAGGAPVIGVLPRFLADRELAHPSLTSLVIVETMHERKHRMIDAGNAFVMLPGGMGTLEEWFEVITWAQIGLHAKPIGILNTAGFFDPLIGFLEQIIAAGFAPPQHRLLFVVADTPAALLDKLEAFEPPPVGDPKTDRRAPV
jgi:uncharacterized protein (TIGR00730 family)